MLSWWKQNVSLLHPLFQFHKAAVTILLPFDSWKQQSKLITSFNQTSSFYCINMLKISWDPYIYILIVDTRLRLKEVLFLPFEQWFGSFIMMNKLKPSCWKKTILCLWSLRVCYYLISPAGILHCIQKHWLIILEGKKTIRIWDIWENITLERGQIRETFYCVYDLVIWFSFCFQQSS